MTAFDTSASEEGQQNGAKRFYFDPLSTSSLVSDSSAQTRSLIDGCCCDVGNDEKAAEKESSNGLPRFSIVCCKQELEQERIAAESAANEAISMIFRLQLEKAALQVEARYYQELFEARSIYDEQTISQLERVISSQEADKIILKREVEDFKKALHELLARMQDGYRQAFSLEDENSPKAKSIIANVTKSMHRGAVLDLYSGEGHKGRSQVFATEESFDCNAAFTVKDAQLMDLISSDESRKEIKTKRMVSSNSSIPLLNDDWRDLQPVAHSLGSVEYSSMSHHYTRHLNSEGDYANSDKICFDTLVRENWVAILMQVSKLQNRMQSLDFSMSSGLTLLGKENDHPNGFGPEQQEKPARIHMDSWMEILAIPHHCLQDLDERFKIFQSRLQCLEVAQNAIADAVRMMPQVKGIGESTLFKALIMLKECFSLAGLSCDILEILHKMVVGLAKASYLEERCAETILGSESEIDARKMQEVSHFSGKTPSGNAVTNAHWDSPPSLWATLRKSARIWSSSLEWLSSERCRAETALSGWDHI